MHRSIVSYVFAFAMLAGGMLALAPSATAANWPPDQLCDGLSGCMFRELNGAYVVQHMEGCGASCSSSYRIRDRATGEILWENSYRGFPTVVIAVRGENFPPHRPEVIILEPEGSGMTATIYQSPAGGQPLSPVHRDVYPRTDLNLESARAELERTNFRVLLP